MASIRILDSGHINRSDSAFPTLVRLDNGDIVCGYSVGGGPNATGRTDCAVSRDEGKTWDPLSVVLADTQQPRTTNHLRLSRAADGELLAYGCRTYRSVTDKAFAKNPNEPTLCRSRDAGRTWSAPEVIPTNVPGPLEISAPILALADGRCLAPAATLSDPERLGEKVIAFESQDRGATWPHTRTVMIDPKGENGYFEHKMVETIPGRLMAVCWTVRLGSYDDLENHYALSTNGGRTWSDPQSTGIRGQTMTPVWLGGDGFLVLYNRRYGRQGVVMCLARVGHDGWRVESEDLMWDAQAERERPTGDSSKIDEFYDFQFGLPSALRLDDRTFLAVHWCKEDGVFGVRWTLLEIT